MMAQNDLVVVGIDVAKDQVDACIRSLSLRQTCLSTAQGHRKLIAWLRKHKVNKAVMEASGGYERGWARVVREAGIEVRVVDPKRVRSFARSAGRLAKNDTIDAEMIAWFAETFSEAPSQKHDAAREELQTLVKARLGLIDSRMRLASQSEHAAPGLVQKAHAHILKSLAVETTKLEAVSRRRRWRASASLEAGRSPGYFQHSCSHVRVRHRRCKTRVNRPRERWVTSSTVTRCF
jgi:transposase